MQLDAKNSPLALLAQTCSSIGKDPTPPLQAAGASHKTTPGGTKESSSTSINAHQHHHHGHKDDRVRPKSESPRAADDHRATKCPGARDRPKDARPGPSSGKGQSPPKSGGGRGARELSDRLSPVDGIALPPRIRDGAGGKPTAAAAVVSSSSVGGGSLVSSGASKPGAAATSLPGASSLFDDSVQRFAALHQQLSLAVAAAAAGRGGSLYGAPGAAMPPLFPSLPDHHSFTGGQTPLYPGLLGGGPFPLLGGPAQVDPVQLQQLYALAAQSSPSVYADYAARLKAAATSSTGSCKDPFCVRCPLGAPGCAAAAASAPSSAADKHAGPVAPLLPSAAGSAMLAAPLPFLPAASLHALLLQQMSAAAAAATSGSTAGDPASSAGGGGGGYTCSWVDGAADFCGLRFSSSDDLLAHLRVHAAAADPSGAALPPAAHPAALAALAAAVGDLYG